MPEQLIIAFNPMAAATRVTYWRKQIRRRIIWFAVMIPILAWLYFRQYTLPPGMQMGWMLVIIASYSVIWLAVSIVGWVRAKSQLKAISPGIAAAIDRRGIWLQGIGLAWGEIAGVALKPGLFKGSPSLVVTGSMGQSAQIALANLDVMPGTIDSAVRSYSAGTHRVDPAKLKH